MDDPYPVTTRDRATWQSDAERRSERQPTRWRRPLGIGGGALVVVALIVAGTLYWLNTRHFESTDDAFVDGYVTQVAPQVAGRVVALKFSDNQHVSAGQILMLIDPRDYQVKLDQVKAQRVSASAALEQAKAQITAQEASLNQARSNVRVAEADMMQAQKDYERFTSINPHAVSQQQVDSATAAYRAAQAKLDASRQAVQGAEAQLVVGHAQVLAAQAQVQQADADVAAAELQLSYCTIVAPVSGRIGHRTTSVGNYVNPGQPLFALVQDDMWVTANFKETQLAAVHPGQPVDIAIDAIPSVTFHGHVDSLQPGTGSAFSVLPAENATGNYVKIVQRVPVKIDLDEQAKKYPLSPGLSAVPSIRVH